MNVPSPCIQVCQLDEGDVCTGCYRTQNEIARWIQMTEDEKLEVVSALAGRRLEATTDE